MAKRMKLKTALDRHKGVNHTLDRQKKLQKQAQKRKREKNPSDVDNEAPDEVTAGTEDDDEEEEVGDDELEVLELADDPADLQQEEIVAKIAELAKKMGAAADGWETDESEDEEEERLKGGVDLEGIEDDSESESDEEIIQNGTKSASYTNGDAADEGEDEDEAEDGEEIALSDIESLASEDRADVVPYQRLTINNTAALRRSLKSFALPSSLPFSATQSVTSSEPVRIADVEDDLTRELAFYKQSLDAVKVARTQLKAEGVMFSRPSDYFAEMVKSEEQMGRVRQKMVDEAARKKASSDARRQRDLKKFGKAVQVAKLQERDKAKKDTLDKINLLKRKRQGAELGAANEDNMFDVALEDAAEKDRGGRTGRREKGAGAGSNFKRQKKNEKFGFGGKKRFSKSNDARSSGETTGYSVKRMKNQGGKPQRPGKSRRAAGR